MKHLNKYDEFTKKITDLSLQKEKTIESLKDTLSNDIETELSKYFDKIVVKQEDLKNIYEKELSIFLIDEDYGVSYKINYSTYSNDISASLFTFHKNILGKWTKNKSSEYFETSENLEDYIKNLADKLIKRNVTRKQEKEKRQLKRNIDKYNI